MIKQLTLFCTFAIFMLAVGGAVTSVWAHAVCTEDGKGKHSLGHPHCVDGTTTDGSLYDVSVSGALLLDPSKIGHDGVGNKESVSVNYDFVDMDLRFFQYYFGDDDQGNGDGFKCFSDAPVEGRQAVLFIGHDKTGDYLEATYTFSGYGTDGTTRTGYRLKLSTDAYGPGWRPTDPTVPSELTFNQWQLYNKNDIACIDKGDFSTTILIDLRD